MLIVNVGLSHCDNISILDSILEDSKNIIGKVRGNRHVTCAASGWARKSDLLAHPLAAQCFQVFFSYKFRKWNRN